MTTFLVTEWFGAFRLENGRVAAQSLFPRDPEALGERLKALQDGEVLPEERELAAAGPVTVFEDRLLQLPGTRLGRDQKPPQALRPQDYNFTLPLLHEASLALGRLAVREASGGRDKHVVMAVETIDDLLEAGNLLTERLREWYGLHAPELVERVDRPEELAALVSAHGTREAIAAARPEYAVEKSMGAPLTEEDLVALRAFSRSVSHLYSSKAEIEKHLDNTMPAVAPNLTALLGATLAARFIRTAGGLERLARMPAGTVQTLGAEKALFRHIKEGKKPPKHGLLFQHLSLHRAPRHQRGALARALAAKVCIAARADAFTKADLRELLVGQWEGRENTIRREHGTPRYGRERPTHPTGRPHREARPSFQERGRAQGYPPRGQGPPPARAYDNRGPPGGGFRDRPPRGDAPPRGAYPPRADGPPRGDRPYQDRPPRGDRPYEPRGPPGGGFQDRPPRGTYPPRGDAPPRGDRPYQDRAPAPSRPYQDRPPRGDKPYDNRGPPPSRGYSERAPGERTGFTDRPPRDRPYDDRGAPPGRGGPPGGGPGGGKPPYGKKKYRGGDRQ